MNSSFVSLVVAFTAVSVNPFDLTPVARGDQTQFGGVFSAGSREIVFSRVINSDLAHDPQCSLLGRRLMDIRSRIIASGAPLLSWDEIDAQVAELRGKV